MSVVELPPLRVVPHQFTSADLCSGHVVLNFINTAAGLNLEPRDLLDSYGRLVEWAALAGICNASGAQGLLSEDAAHPRAGHDALAQVRRLRTALYLLFHAARTKAVPPVSAVDELEAWCRRGGSTMRMRWQADGSLGSSFEGCGLHSIGVIVAAAAAALLVEPIGENLGVCAGRNCGWLFLDTSKSRRRRWCDMRTCGNAAKASRHYHRSR